VGYSGPLNSVVGCDPPRNRTSAPDPGKLTHAGPSDSNTQRAKPSTGPGSLVLGSPCCASAHLVLRKCSAAHAQLTAIEPGDGRERTCAVSRSEPAAHVPRAPILGPIRDSIRRSKNGASPVHARERASSVRPVAPGLPPSGDKLKAQLPERTDQWQSRSTPARARFSWS
jgi:hypothetical protein